MEITNLQEGKNDAKWVIPLDMLLFLSHQDRMDHKSTPQCNQYYTVVSGNGRTYEANYLYDNQHPKVSGDNRPNILQLK